MASQVPGLRSVSERMNEKAFVRWMESDPIDEVKVRVKNGHYKLLGVAHYADRERWIPGVSGPKKDHVRTDVTWQGMGGYKAQYIEITEDYMSKFNQAMLLERKGVVLDVYARGPRSRDYLKPSKDHEG